MESTIFKPFKSEPLVKTPLVTTEEGITVKCENKQLYGSYKIRGIRHILDNTESSILEKGLVTVSAGNMARALAAEALARGMSVKVYLPQSAPQVKKEALQALGCAITERSFQEIWELVERNGPQGEGFLIHPLNPVLREGYGQLADEIALQYPAVQTVVIPYGCGGLFLGIAERFRKIKPEIKLIVAEADHATPIHAALKAGKIVPVERHASFIDAIGTPSALEGALPLVRQLATKVLIATQGEVRKALKTLGQRYGQQVEGAAATAYAVGLQAKALGYENIVAILSGSNIDPLLHQEISGS